MFHEFNEYNVNYATYVKIDEEVVLAISFGDLVPVVFCK